jgi:molybdopterin-binding protein
MNKLTAVIKSIETEGSLSIVNLSLAGLNFKTIVIENPKYTEYLKVSNKVDILFKETEVVIAKEKEIAISLRNQIPCKILEIQKGKLLSRLNLGFDKYKIVSIITSKSVELLNLRAGDEILAMIKTNEIMLAEC